MADTQAVIKNSLNDSAKKCEVVLKILILGSTGTVGEVLFERLSREHHWEIFGTTTATTDSMNRFKFIFPQEDIKELFMQIQPDVLINCIAKLNSRELETDTLMQEAAITLNALLPASLNKLHPKVKVIHVSTDAVFSGKRSKYHEDSLADGKSIYARTKLAGEKNLQNGLILRASILGRSRDKEISIPNKIRNASGKKKLLVPYNEYWNGITTHAFAEIIYSLLSNFGCSFASGIQHILPVDKVSKYHLFCSVARQISHSPKVIEGIILDKPQSIILTTNNMEFLENVWAGTKFNGIPTVDEMLKMSSL